METVIAIDPSLNKEILLEISGWNKLTIEYSNEIFNGVNYLCWRVKGTNHIFKTTSRTVYEHHGTNVSDHFSLTLQAFREDYLEWTEKVQEAKYNMEKYQKEFHKLIKL